MSTTFLQASSLHCITVVNKCSEPQISLSSYKHKHSSMISFAILILYLQALIRANMGNTIRPSAAGLNYAQESAASLDVNRWLKIIVLRLHRLRLDPACSSTPNNLRNGQGVWQMKMLLLKNVQVFRSDFSTCCKCTQYLHFISSCEDICWLYMEETNQKRSYSAQKRQYFRGILHLCGYFSSSSTSPRRTCCSDYFDARSLH